MFKKIVSAVKYLTGRDVAGKNLHVYEDDTFIVSYPKSGNTWTRFLVGNLIHPAEPVTFLTADKIIPAIDGQSKHFFKKLPRPRVIKSHFPFDPSYKRVVYIVRDPKDVALSQYHYQIKRRVLEEGHAIEEFISRFVAGETCPYGSWGENVASWLAARHGTPGFLLLKYEDMLSQTPVELVKVANFLGIEPTIDRITKATERSSADRMRKLEQTEASKWDSTKGTRADLSFVRLAKAGGWRTSLSPQCVAKIEAAWGPLINWLGYPLSCAVEKKTSALLESVLQQPRS